MSFFKKLLATTTGRDSLQAFSPELNAFATNMLGARPEVLYGQGDYAGDFLGGDAEGAGAWDRRYTSEALPAFIQSLSPERRTQFQQAQQERSSNIDTSNKISKLLALSTIAASAGGAGLEAFGAGAGAGGAEAGNLAADYVVTPGGVVDAAGNPAFVDTFGSGAFGNYNNPAFTSGYGNFGGTGTFNNPAFASIPGGAGGAEFGYVGGAAGGGGFFDSLSNLFSGQAFGLPGLPSNFGFNPATGRTLAGLYGLYESERLRKLTKLPNPADVTNMPGYQAGLEAVRRSMASQGYQGSGNMMLALHKYGGDMYNQYTNQRLNSAMAGSGPATGALSSFALLSNGLGGLYGR